MACTHVNTANGFNYCVQPTWTTIECASARTLASLSTPILFGPLCDTNSVPLMCRMRSHRQLLSKLCAGDPVLRRRCDMLTSRTASMRLRDVPRSQRKVRRRSKDARESTLAPQPMLLHAPRAFRISHCVWDWVGLALRSSTTHESKSSQCARGGARLHELELAAQDGLALVAAGVRRHPRGGRLAALHARHLLPNLHPHTQLSTARLPLAPRFTPSSRRSINQSKVQAACCASTLYLALKVSSNQIQSHRRRGTLGALRMS